MLPGMTALPAAYAALDAAASPAFSMDGTTLYHLRGPGLPQLWALDLGTGQSRQLTHHDEKIATLRRAPGDDRLVYGIDARGDERQQIWLWDGTSRALTEAPGVIHGLGSISPDGTRLAFTANDRDEAHFDILLMDLATGARTRVHHGRHECTLGAWHKDGTRLIAMAELATGDVRPFILDITTGATAPVHETAPRFRAPMDFSSLRWAPDGEAVIGLTDAGGEFVQLCRIDPFQHTITPVFAPESDVEAWAMSPDGALLATVENDRGYALLRVGSMVGDRPAVKMPPGMITDLSWSKDGRLAFVHATPTQPAGLWLWEAGAVRCVSQPECALPVQDFALVEWPGFDGRPIAGWLAHPPGPAPEAGRPAIIWVHGGPASQARATFRPDMQALLAQGYAVLMPNVRGSTGYGRTFMELDDTDRRLDSVHDLAAAHRFVAAKPGIDPARIGIMGQSYGGYMVLAAITEYPALWRTAIDFYGISDFGTLLAATGPWRRDHRAAEYGDPVRHRALFDRISPLRHIERIRAPLLVLHGTRDPRVPIGESEQLVEAMGARTKPVAYEVFGYAGHGFVRPDDKTRVFTAIADFLRRTL